MKIALVSDGIWPERIGGIQKHTFEFAIQLADLGVEVDLFYIVEKKEISNWSGIQSRRFINVFPTTFYSIPSLFPGHYLFDLYRKSKILQKEIHNKSFNPDFIFIQGLLGCAFEKDNIKTICHLHGLEMFQKSFSFKELFSKKVLQTLAKKTVKNSDFQCFYGPYSASLLRDLGAKKLIRFPNAVRFNSKTLAPQNSGDIEKKDYPMSMVYLGRHEFRKGIHLLLRVLKELIGQYHFYFHFIGPIPPQKRIIHPRIIYHGALHSEYKIQLILRKVSVLVLPSFAEGMPTCILEGMKERLAIITTTVGENRLLVNELNGWLIPPNQQEDLKSAFVKALESNPESLLLKGSYSYQMVTDRFNWNQITGSFLKQLKDY